MIAPPIPPNEKERLEALIECQILDTPDERAFDNITRIAAEICKVPVAAISFIDQDRQWIKSSFGLDIDEGPRKISICAHTINFPTLITEVPDTLLDDRFKNNPMVVDKPNIRFYAGIPICNDEGLALGAICLVDYKPSSLTDDQRLILKALAQQTASQVELHRKNKELERKNTQIQLKEEKWKDLVEHLSDMVYELDENGQFSYVNPSFVKISGYSEKQLLKLKFWNLVHPKDADSLIKFYKNIFKQKITSSYYEFCMQGKDGITWVGQNVEIEFNKDRITRAYAVARDITEIITARNQLIDSEEKYRLISENSKDVISLHDKHGSTSFVSESIKEFLGYSPDELIGPIPTFIMHPEDAQRIVKQIYINIHATGKVSKIECRLKTKNGDYIWVEATVHTITDQNKKITGFQASTRNISERKQNESEIYKKQSNLEALIENTDDAIAVIDLDLEYVSFNLVYEEKIAKAGIGAKLTSDNMKAKCQSFLDSVHQGLNGTKFNKVHTFKLNDFEWYYDCHFNPILGEGDKAFALAIQMRDVTEKTLSLKRGDEYKKSLSILNEIISNTHISASEQINRALELGTNFLNLPLGIVSTIEPDAYYILNFQNKDPKVSIDPSRKFNLENSFCSKAFGQITTIAIDSTSEEESHAHPCYETLNLKSYLGAPYFVKRQQRGTVNFSSQISRDEPFSTIETEFINILSRWVGFLIEKHEHRQELVTERDFLRTFVASAPAAIAMFNKNLEYMAVSNKWLGDYNLKEETLLGKSHYEVFPWTRAYWESIINKAFNGEVQKSDAYKLIRHDRITQWITWEIRPWYSSTNKIGGVVIYTQDITEQRAQEQELRKAKILAEEASKAKQEFLSTMSHEIRTPMNTIVGVTNLLIGDEPKPEQVSNLEMLKFSSQNLLGIINDVLDFNKIEAGKIEFEMVDFNLKQLLVSINQSFYPNAQEKGLDLFLEYDSTLPDVFIGDSIRISQVINNLISNAIKFTQKGFVKISVASIKTIGKQNLIQFHIKDTGIGLSDNELNRIFEDFAQGKQETTRKFGGTGLGLSITKKLLRLMGSDIDVKSSTGMGSSFSFKLALTAGSDERILSVNTDNSFKKIESSPEFSKILIVEDNPINVTILEQFLSRWGIPSDAANNGIKGIEKLKSKEYALVIMDVRMPEMDGYEATRVIRKLDSPYFREIPIIALTASATVDMQEKAESVGMTDFLTKPFNPDELFAKISRYISQNFGIYDDTTLDFPVSKRFQKELPYLYQICDGNEKMILDILRTIIETVPTELHQISELAKENDRDQLAEKIHKIKPNLKSLELKDLFKMADKLDQAATRSHDTIINAHLDKFIASILKELARLEHIYFSDK